MPDRLVHFIYLLICFIHDKPCLHTEFCEQSPAFFITSILVRVLYLNESFDSVGVDILSWLILLLVVYLVMVMVVVERAYLIVMDLVFQFEGRLPLIVAETFLFAIAFCLICVRAVILVDRCPG